MDHQNAMTAAGSRWLVALALLAGSAACERRPEQVQASSPPVTVAISTAAAPAREKVAEKLPANSFYVLERTEERLGPSKKAKVTNTLDRQQVLEVFERREGWARVSPYYDGEVEGQNGRVARWVPSRTLSKTRPKDLVQPRISDDPRVAGIAKAGEGGLKRRDVEVLHAAARYYLQTGRARRVEYGDKSASKPGVYFLNVGEVSTSSSGPQLFPTWSAGFASSTSRGWAVVLATRARVMVRRLGRSAR
jgi:hypothetical protein